jgi:hypothetical protein
MVGRLFLACALFAIALASSTFLMLVVGLLGLAGLRGNRHLSFRYRMLGLAPFENQAKPH